MGDGEVVQHLQCVARFDVSIGCNNFVQGHFDSAGNKVNDAVNREVWKVERSLSSSYAALCR